MLTLSLANRISELPRVTEAVESFLGQKRFSADVMTTVQLALDELIANTILWAYEDRREHRITVTVTTSPAQVRLVIEDDGREFDPTSASSPDVCLKPEHRKEGGLGLHLVRSMAEDVTYRRVDGRNVVEVKVPVGRSPRD